MIIESADIGDDEVLVYVNRGADEFEMQDMSEVSQRILNFMYAYIS